MSKDDKATLWVLLCILIVTGIPIGLCVFDSPHDSDLENAGTVQSVSVSAGGILAADRFIVTTTIGTYITEGGPTSSRTGQGCALLVRESGWTGREFQYLVIDGCQYKIVEGM